MEVTVEVEVETEADSHFSDRNMDSEMDNETSLKKKHFVSLTYRCKSLLKCHSLTASRM